ncbi:hypothetical protein [Polyangium spumosum]|uniref:Uncharacterized protein n=1 Tax=Polyangium spumosum TaxID=889282 RepID=A0A6N7PQV5_9BACT|nr:hypothetical protein [Polyangium spumosum]MRG94007.1 hypothetical protein [Polyangium spumosum]
MESRLKDFLTDVALNHDQLMVFLTDPQSSIRSAQLSSEDERVLQTGNPDAIFAHIKGWKYDPAERLSSCAYGNTNQTWPFYCDPGDPGEAS